MTLIQELDAMQTIGCNPEMIKQNFIVLTRAFSETLEGEEMVEIIADVLRKEPLTSGGKLLFVGENLAERLAKAALALVREAIG